MDMHETTKTNADTKTLLRLFVYGTLKRGYWNHDRLCRDRVSIAEATVRGQLYELPSGIPALAVEDEDVLAQGTGDPLADAVTQREIDAGISVKTGHRIGDVPRLVRGELVTFDDPARHIPPIDRLEGFFPGRSSLYVRVLVPVVTSSEDIVAAWCYVFPSKSLSGVTPLTGDSWP